LAIDVDFDFHYQTIQPTNDFDNDRRTIMKPSQIAAALEALVRVRQPVFLWGAPGVGKSQVVAQVARRRGLELRDVRAVLLDPVDLRGVPRIGEDGSTVWCPPSFLPRRGAGILFLDELNAAPPLVQAACYQLLLDRRIGEYELPGAWTVVAAGNRESDRAVTHRMPSALANRMVHLDFEADIADWLAWAQATGVAPEVVAFLRFRPALLHVFDPARNDKAFPSPRSWEFVSRVLAAGPGAIGGDGAHGAAVSSALDADVLRGVVRGAVGEGAAAEFLGFLDMCAALPDVDEVLADPAGVALPDEPAVICALCEAVARRADGAAMPGLAALAARLPVEFGVLLMRGAVAADPSVVETEAFDGWACANSDVLM
jgi:MoxR-like ATPase